MSRRTQHCTTAEASVRLGVTRPTVIAWLRKGTLRGRLATGAGGRKTWRVDVASVDECLIARGGPGAHRGRPAGSTAGVLKEMNLMRRRIEVLEARSEHPGVPAASLTVLSALLELLRADGLNTANRSQDLVRATEQLASLLNSGET